MLYFNIETRSFGFIQNNEKRLLGAGSIALGSTIGRQRARNKAMDDAQAKGLQPGTLAYKQYVNRRGRTGGSIGASVGAVGGMGASAGLSGLSSKLNGGTFKSGASRGWKIWQKGKLA